MSAALPSGHIGSAGPPDSGKRCAFTADYWKLIQTADGGYGWEWDGSLDFDVSVLRDDPSAPRLLMNASPELRAALAGFNESRVSYEEMDAGIVSEIASALFPRVSGNRLGGLEWLPASHFEQEAARSGFASGTLDFVTASAAAGAMTADPSQSRIDELNAALLGVQGSGLLLRQEARIDTQGLVNVGTEDTPVYVPVRLADGDGVHTITSYPGLRIVDPERGITNHSGIDLGRVSDSDVVAAADGSAAQLRWDSTYGLSVFNSFSIMGTSFENRLGHLETSPTVSDYLAAFGTEGVKLTGTGLQGLHAGMVLGEAGNTGYSFGQHLDIRTFENGFLVDPLVSQVYGTYFDSQASATWWARTLSALPGSTPEESWKSPETWRRIEEYWRTTRDVDWLWALGVVP